jgi:hypothetical protein
MSLETLPLFSVHQTSDACLFSDFMLCKFLGYVALSKVAYNDYPGGMRKWLWHTLMHYQGIPWKDNHKNPQPVRLI